MKAIATVPSRFARLRAALMPTCRQMSLLLSEALDHPQTIGCRLRMALHLAGCRLCRRYRRQLRWLHQAGRKVRGQEIPNARIPDSMRSRLKETLRGRNPSPDAPGTERPVHGSGPAGPHCC